MRFATTRTRTNSTTSEYKRRHDHCLQPQRQRIRIHSQARRSQAIPASGRARHRLGSRLGAARCRWLVRSFRRCRACGIPIWPHPRYAQRCAADDWHDAAPAAISIEDFVEEWLPNMAQEELLIAVFPTPSDAAVFVSPLQLQAALRAALDQYE